MKNNMLRGVLLVAGVLSGCGADSPSKAVPTSEIYPRFTVETDGDGVSQVAAQLAEYYDPYFAFFDHTVSLSGGDEIIVRAAGQEARYSGPDSAFEATLQTGIAADTEFVFDFQRPKLKDAPNSIGYLPEPMQLTAPDAGQQYAIASDVMLVTWHSGGTLDDMRLEIRASCAPDDPLHDEYVGIDIEGDPGIYALRLADHFDEAGCPSYSATVKLIRERDGAIDPAFAPNEEECGDDCEHQERYSLRQVRTVPVTLVR